MRIYIGQSRNSVRTMWVTPSPESTTTPERRPITKNQLDLNGLSEMNMVPCMPGFDCKSYIDTHVHGQNLLPWAYRVNTA